ncbi:MAG: putative resolvase, partial [Promethearchaeota archaeon]
MRVLFMNTVYISIGHAAQLLGVCTKTLRRWDAQGMCPSDFRTKGNHRRYKKARILDYIFPSRRKRKEVTSQCAVYGRVSGSRQKKSGDLKRQLTTLTRYCQQQGYRVYKCYSDVGSGLNDKRRGLLKLLRDASLGKFEQVVVTYNDRLARFGLQILKEYLHSWNVRLTVLHAKIVEASPHAELI